jgi:hypothetical protein
MQHEKGLLTVAGQLVRENAVTRLSHNTAAGVSGMQYYVHFTDGGAATISEIEYRKLKKRFEEPTSSRKKTA